MVKFFRGIFELLGDIFSLVVGSLQYLAIALICYCYSFLGFMYFCAFMEWEVPTALNMEKFWGDNPPTLTISSLIHMDWGAWWAEANQLLLILQAIALIIILGIIFLAFYLPYRAFLAATSEKLEDINYKLAKRIALGLSLISHPVIWYIGLHYAESLAAVFLLILLVFLNLFIWSYVAIFLFLALWGPALGGLSAGISGVRASTRSASGRKRLARLPYIVYDDENRQWKRRGIFGDHAEYCNDYGETVIIYDADISGSSATTSAGNLHWY